MDDIVLTPEQRAAWLKEKTTNFIEGMKKVETETGMTAISILSFSEKGIVPVFKIVPIKKEEPEAKAEPVKENNDEKN